MNKDQFCHHNHEFDVTKSCLTFQSEWYWLCNVFVLWGQYFSFSLPKNEFRFSFLLSVRTDLSSIRLLIVHLFKNILDSFFTAFNDNWLILFLDYRTFLNVGYEWYLTFRILNSFSMYLLYLTIRTNLYREIDAWDRVGINERPMSL